MDTTQQRGQRRRYTLAFKRQVVEETFSGDESISVVARRYDLNANLLFNWRRRYRAGALSGAAEETAALLPIRLATAVDERPKPKHAAPNSRSCWRKDTGFGYAVRWIRQCCVRHLRSCRGDRTSGRNTDLAGGGGDRYA